MDIILSPLPALKIRLPLLADESPNMMQLHDYDRKAKARSSKTEQQNQHQSLHWQVGTGRCSAMSKQPFSYRLN